jgi:hypothetical protein
MTTSFLSPASTGSAVPFADPLKMAVGAYLGRFKGSSRERTGSDLRVYLAWCAARDLSPLTAQRADLERYVRWMQETRRFKPSTVSRRISVLAGFYRTCVPSSSSAPAPSMRHATSSTLASTRLDRDPNRTADKSCGRPEPALHHRLLCSAYSPDDPTQQQFATRAGWQLSASAERVKKVGH